MKKATVNIHGQGGANTHTITIQWGDWQYSDKKGQLETILNDYTQ